MTKYFALAAGTDPLTQLSNLYTAWVGFDRLMSELSCDDEQRSNPIEAIVAIGMDIQGFKEVNNTYGHTGGDALLVRLAELLLANTRWGDIVARVGGDEFLVLIPLRWADLLRGGGGTLAFEDVADLEQRFVAACEKYSAGVGVGEPGIALHIKTAIVTRREGLLGGSRVPTFREVRDKCDPKRYR